MLEIYFIFSLWKKMRTMMLDRGYEKTVWFQITVPICWIIGELVGAVGYYAMLEFRGIIRPTGFDPPLYLMAYSGAGICTGLTFLICRGFLKSTPPPLPSGYGQMPDAFRRG